MDKILTKLKESLLEYRFLFLVIAGVLGFGILFALQEHPLYIEFLHIKNEKLLVNIQILLSSLPVLILLWLFRSYDVREAIEKSKEAIKQSQESIEKSQENITNTSLTRGLDFIEDENIKKVKLGLLLLLIIKRDNLKNKDICNIVDTATRSKKYICDSSKSDLSEADFVGANLSWANLSRSDLNEADLNGADLSWAKLSWADLSKASLSWAKLNRANLSWAHLVEANLKGAHLSEANLSWADLKGANLSWADLSWANLNGIRLNEADLSWADFSGADLSGASLNGAKYNSKTKFPKDFKGYSKMIKVENEDT